MMKILVIQLSRMGDVIITLPLLKSLKVEYGECEITMVCYREFTGLLEGSPLIDRFVHINIGEISKLAQFDQDEADKSPFPEMFDEYDILINLAYDVWPSKLSTKVKAKTRYGRVDAKKEEIRLLGDWMKYLFSFIHNRDYNLFNMADIFTRCGGIKNREVSDTLPFPGERGERALELLRENGWDGKDVQSLVALQMGASEAQRAWETGKFARLAQELKAFDANINIVLIGTKNELPLAEKFLSLVDFPVINVMGKTTILELPAVLAQCRLLISNDTGPVHIAAGVGAQVLAMDFASAYFAETGPYGEGHFVIQSETDCYPCTDYCDCSHLKCKTNLTSEALSDVARAILSGRDDFTFDHPNLSVYKSRFLANGSLMYAPLFPERLSPHFQKGLLYRVIWEEPGDIDVYREFIAETIPNLKNLQSFVDIYNTFGTELNNLLQIFSIGIAACDMLLIAFSKGNVTQDAIAQPLQQLNIIEGFLDKREEPLTPIKHYFSFVMMDMEYLQFPALAKELKSKYQKLQAMVNKALSNLDRFTAP
jgi:ADP-heptose:LPS heptosyltransferase